MKKSLGQHFLNNPTLAEKIVRLANIQEGDTVLEIGPGEGILTAALLRAGAQVTVIEVDRDLIPRLKERFSGNNNLEIIEGDVLELLGVGAPFMAPAFRKVVANLPYNIATEIIFRLLEGGGGFSDLFLMVQKEVGERLVAKAGGKKYGLLSILTQIYSENKIVLKVSPRAFKPPPKVESVVVHFNVSKGLRYPIQDLSMFKELVRASFGSRRKMIKNSLQDHFQQVVESSIWEARLASAGIGPTERAEAVPLEKWVALANSL